MQKKVKLGRVPFEHTIKILEDILIVTKILNNVGMSLSQNLDIFVKLKVFFLKKLFKVLIDSKL